MRISLSLCLATPALFSIVTASGFPWPWSSHNATTTPAPTSAMAFGKGVASALGFNDASRCLQDSKASISDLLEAAKDYRQGGYVSKAKALVRFGEAMKSIEESLAPCSSTMGDASKFKTLVKDLEDPRYYTVRNALALSLNLAEDRNQLRSFVKALEQGDYYTAGSELTATLLDVMSNPAIPSSNGTAATQIAYGLATGFAANVKISCFTDVSIEIPALVGGVLDLATVIEIPKGLESIFHGLEGIVPAYKQCMSDIPKIKSLLHELGDFRHPAELAKLIGHNIVDHSIDLSLETASAILDYKGKTWERFGQDIGKILSKIATYQTSRVASGDGFPWPWSSHNASTTPAPSSASAFAKGVASALGFDDASSCLRDSKTSISDVIEAAKDYRQGGYVSKAKALLHFGEAMKNIEASLAPCSSTMQDASKFKTLVKDLEDPRYYTAHNAVTLCLNMAEDRKQLGSFVAALEKGDYYTAGSELTAAVLDVMANPGIPSSNGTAATQIAYGLATGFAANVEISCFTDVSIEIPAIVGGVLDLATVIEIPKGLESIFHGLEGIVPTYKQCMSDIPKMKSLLHEVGDFRHPAELAKLIGRNIVDHSIDLSLETASAVLDFKGKEWERFGRDIGQILSKIAVLPSTTIVV